MIVFKLSMSCIHFYTYIVLFMYFLLNAFFIFVSQMSQLALSNSKVPLPTFKKNTVEGLIGIVLASTNILVAGTK